MNTTDPALTGRTALVTGSTSGLGAGIAVALAAAGAQVVVTGRTRTRGEDVVAQIESKGGRAVFISVDFAAGPDAVAELAAAACAAVGGQLDVLVNNVATLVQPAPTADVTAEEIAAAFSVSVTTPFLLTGLIAPAMAERGDGAIVNVSAAIGNAISRFGRLDVLVNNAGYANMGAIEDVDFGDFRTQVDTNFFGVVRLTQAALPIMRAQRAGHIIQVSSVGGRLTRPGLAAYQSAKWAVTGFSGVLGQEVAPLGIKVTVLEPGGMRTDWAGSSMHVEPIRADYAATVGAAAAASTSQNLGASDPAKVAALLLEVVGMAEPPNRLLVGPDAYRYATAAGRDLLAKDEKWEALSISTAADDATNDQLDPLGSSHR